MSTITGIHPTVETRWMNAAKYRRNHDTFTPTGATNSLASTVAQLPGMLLLFLMGLRRLWAVAAGEAIMNETLTPERVLEMGQQWQKLLLEQISDEASPPANPARNK